LQEHLFPPDTTRPKKYGLLALVAVGFMCLVVGIVISSRLDLPHRSMAQGVSGDAQFASTPPVVERNGEYESPFVAVVEKTKDAVVNVSARTENPEYPWWFHGGGYGTSSGSGFFFREDGYILTNNHVVKNAKNLTVRTSTGYEYSAKLVGTDQYTDLAVLKVEPEEKVTVISFGNSDAMKVGDWAIAIGNPFPQQGLDRTVTVGVVSAKGRSNLEFGEDTPTFQNYIQTDAAINPGNSGGPLLNLRGEVIGVNAAISSPTGTSVGIGFAIPINLARAVVPDLIATGKASRGWLGVRLADVTERQAKRLGLKAVKGVVIDTVFTNSPADQAGMRRGDLVTKFNGTDVDNMNEFMVEVSTIKAGVRVPMEVIRDGETMTVYATVGDRDASSASASRQGAPSGVESQEWLGMQVVDFTPSMARQLGIKHIPGVYVARVFPGTAADRASISEGTVITQINGRDIESIGDVADISKNMPTTGSRIPLIVLEPDGSMARKMLRP
jgi:serine protease Do